MRVREDAAVTCAELIAHLREGLPLYKVPRVYASVPDWPLTRSGKTDFDMLGQAWIAGTITRRLP